MTTRPQYKGELISALANLLVENLEGARLCYSGPDPSSSYIQLWIEHEGGRRSCFHIHVRKVRHGDKDGWRIDAPPHVGWRPRHERQSAS